MTNLTSKNKYFFYILRCSDNSLYCGTTPDLKRRLNEHNFSLKRGAKYTWVRRPVSLVYFEEHTSVSGALQREREVKSWTKIEKEVLVTNMLRRVTIKP